MMNLKMYTVNFLISALMKLSEGIGCIFGLRVYSAFALDPGSREGSKGTKPDKTMMHYDF